MHFNLLEKLEQSILILISQWTTLTRPFRVSDFRTFAGGGGGGAESETFQRIYVRPGRGRGWKRFVVILLSLVPYHTHTHTTPLPLVIFPKAFFNMYSSSDYRSKTKTKQDNRR
jgi:hypothetical protein